MGRRKWIAAWAVLVVAATFVEAIVRLAARAREQLSGELSVLHWVAFAGLTVVMTYVEGHRALQRRFVPSVVDRAFTICERGRARSRWAILAPLYAVSLIGAPRRVIGRTLLGIAAIVVCVVLVRGLPAPWRGVVDGAVAMALAWGLVCLIARFVSAFLERTEALPAEVT